MANKAPNTEGILKHSKGKTEHSTQKVDEALKYMIKKQLNINFNSVAEQAKVSKGFLYKNHRLRSRIETLRKQQEGLSSGKQVKRNISDASKDVIIASLRERLKRLEQENKELKEKVKIQFGKIYDKI
ncbi:transposase [Oceanobacillus iheyensis]|nr:transposase [Oceanobacillus iheyensis]